MNELMTAITTGITAFTATNIDDLVILTLLFSQVNKTFRSWHIVIGQYLGFGTLIVASLVGFAGGLILPASWTGLLGLVPIAAGISRLLHPEDDSSATDEPEADISNYSSQVLGFLSPQIYSVASITIANGGDNVGIYMPLFANTSFYSLLIIISTFLLLVGVWCFMTYKLTCQPIVANIITQYGNNFVPLVLISIGVFIVLDHASLTPMALVISCVCLALIMKIIQVYKAPTVSRL
ncbi:cadmium resistance transporter [Nostoc sp. TCL26-01]|uniref:cadmium resistance transporter n=1 Tax=Nostoc sp. TCL26-01 TaxID=2576904 RepID=UPI0015BB751A|nr:cadmium resistance transporter [Nostoc sp. TCL26-01]QLE57173.1 transporter [Nostoc sp. TCL26-01]